MPAWATWFDPATGRNLRRIDSADTLAYLNRNDALINPVLPTNHLSLCYATNGQVVPIPQAWLDGEALTAWLASSNATVLNISITRSNRIFEATQYVLSTNSTENYVIRAMLNVIMNRMNQLATNTNAVLAWTTNTMWNLMLNSITNDPR